MQLTYPASLPITAWRERIVDLIRTHPVLIVAGETGSGKTTQLPKFCLEAGFGLKKKIGCTQPRRVAAYSVADRIAEELGVTLGKEIGCKVRFDDRTGPETRVQIMTDGILLAEIQADPLLQAYDVLIIDEAHERSLNIDFLIGYLQLLRAKRPDLKIILTSATIDTERFAAAFEGSTVVKVEGRTFPVEIVYRPLGEKEDSEGYVEGAFSAIQDILNINQKGDVLVFLPGEGDIRELRDALDGLKRNDLEVLPLFSRLSRLEQHRIFETSSKRKIILATNIAETSITIPGIVYVVDTGLVRLNRYNPHTRTQRLPIEPISRNSAKQRAGRAGRVSEGVCIRLYSEKDFLLRTEHTPPQIRRSNLAEVILKMIAFHLGNIETFPFIDPPDERSIRAAYKLLKELGALTAQKQLTVVGEQLSSLPIDPTVGAMLLQARKEHALQPVLIIAAALSIQDPRERPMEMKEQAEAAHRKFNDPQSDFLTLLNLWEAYHKACENLGQKALRRFCKAHFLSYLRMREWRDVHAQLKQAMEDIGQYRESVYKADYRAIHRSLLVGLLSNVAEKEKGNVYRATHSRKVTLFPGSGLFDRKEKKDQKLSSIKDSSKTPTWIFCATWMETSQLFAHTAAALDPAWAAELGSHITHSHFTEPYWDKKSARVLAKEKIYLHGLLIDTKTVGYSSIDSEKACEIFIREGLVLNDIAEHFDFLENNVSCYESAEDVSRRLRLSGLWDMPEKLYGFYADKIKNISSVAELYKYIRAHGDKHLFISISDLVDSKALALAELAYPKKVQLGQYSLSIEYHYKPGEIEDGGTLTVPVEAFGFLDEPLLDRLVPGYLEHRIEAFLRNLPKEDRRKLLPIDEKIGILRQLIELSDKPFTLAIGEVLSSEYGVILSSYIRESSDDVPFRLRIAVSDKKRNILATGRDLNALTQKLNEVLKAYSFEAKSSHAGKVLLEKARKQYEKKCIDRWPEGDIPAKISIGYISGVELFAYPGLCVENDCVCISLFEEEKKAQFESVQGYRALLKKVLASAFKEFHKDLHVAKRLMPYYVTLGSLTDLQDLLAHAVEVEFLGGPVPWPMRKNTFEERVLTASQSLRGLAIRTTDSLMKALLLRQELLSIYSLKPAFQKELELIISPSVLKRLPLSQWIHLERYLKALKIRIVRAADSPQKDLEKASRLAQWERLQAKADVQMLTPAQKRQLQIYEILLAEFKVSLFAQELGTAVPISEKKLKEAWDHLGIT